MKGVVFNLFEKFVVANSDEQTYFDIYDEALPELATKEPYISPGTYPDSDMMLLVGKTISRLNLPLAAAMCAFGRFCFPHLAAKIPEFVDSFTHPKPFLLSVENVIHVEVRKVMRDSVLPRFMYEDPGPGKLVMIYSSPRKLYDFAEGLILGAGDYFGVPIKCVQQVATLSGCEVCEFHLEFATNE